MSTVYPKQTRNFIAFGTDYVFFGLMLGFMNLNTILPTFAAELGATPQVIGLLLSVLPILWSLPQVVAGNVAARLQDKKRLLVRSIAIGRPFTALIPVVIILTGGQPPWLNLLAITVSLAIFFMTDAFAAIPWFDLMGRAFPAERRGGYISIWQVGKAVGLLGISALVGYILSDRGPDFPYSYALLFGGASFCLLMSAVGIGLIHPVDEASGEPATTYIAWKEFAGHLLNLLKTDARLRYVAIARTLFGFSMMAFPFYVLFATGQLGFPEQTIGLFIFAQTVGTSAASLLLGRVADRQGAQRVIQFGIMLAITAPLLALILSLAGGGLASTLRSAYVWIYVCIGLSDNLMMLGFLNYLFDIAPPGQRTIYVGTFNAVASIGLLGPVIAGWVVTHLSYPVLFFTSLCFATASLVMALKLPLARQLAPQAQAGQSPADG